MLLAGPSQTASYPSTNTHPVSSYSRRSVSRLTISSSSTVSKSNESVRSPQSSGTPSSSNQRFSFMKNISSQLNRGTELLKQTVQRAIFSTSTSSASTKGIPEPPPTPVATAKPTPYHSDPHAVTRSCSVDSLHLETCHIRPIRPYSLTPFRRGSLLNCPIVIRPDKDGLVIKFNPLKVKARFKLQKGKEGSAFCSLGINTSPDKSPGKVNKPSPQKASPTVKGKGINSKKRKRSPPEESPVKEDDRENVDLIVEVVPVEEIATKRGRKAPAVTASKATTTSGGRKKVANNNNNNSKIEITKRPTKASKRKSLEQEKQEREDFELAKKLQKELNSSSEGDLLNNNNITNGGATRRMTRNSSVATSYSLRTTRSLSKVSLGSEEVQPVGDGGEMEVKDTEEEIQTTNKTKRSPPRTTKAKKNNGLNSTRSRTTKTVARKKSPMDEKDEVAKLVSKNKETSNRRTTRSKGSHGSAK